MWVPTEDEPVLKAASHSDGGWTLAFNPAVESPSVGCPFLMGPHVFRMYRCRQGACSEGHLQSQGHVCHFGLAPEASPPPRVFFFFNCFLVSWYHYTMSIHVSHERWTLLTSLTHFWAPSFILFLSLLMQPGLTLNSGSSGFNLLSWDYRRSPLCPALVELGSTVGYFFVPCSLYPERNWLLVPLRHELPFLEGA